MEVVLKNLRRLVLALTLILSFTPLKAQFFVSGQSETALRWSYITTPTYKIIYPEGLDSLATEYARSLESVRPAVATSVGMLSNEQYRGKMPVLLLTQEPDANGLVVWAPRRMELQTTPDAYSPEAMDWMSQLNIHETRHASQMQFSNKGKWRLFHILSGEALTGLLDGLYTSSLFLEGDAVVAETALSNAGRGRSAEFLEYYRAAWSSGDWRDWHKWRFGSYRQFTPNKYAQGYVAYAGTRYIRDNGYVVKAYFDDLLEHPAPFPRNSEFHYIGTDGSKKVKRNFNLVAKEFGKLWHENDSLRGGEFMKAETLVPTGKFYHWFEGTVAGDSALYAIRRGKDAESQLVRIDSAGNVTRIAPWAARTSKLEWSEGRLFWSESISDPRWETKGTSRIRTMSKDGRDCRDITKEGRYYHPAVKGDTVAASLYRMDGLTETVLLDATNGHVLERVVAPGTLQVMEPAWVGDELYTSAVTKDGYGIYKIGEDGSFIPVLPPQPVRARNLRSRDGRIFFTSDRSSVNELYSLDVADGTVRQLTLTRFGASDFVLDGGKLYFSETAVEGKPLQILDEGELLNREIDYAEIFRDKVADKISEQEIEMGSAFLDPSSVEVSAPKHYNKVLHSVKIHSWAPIYLDYDEAEKMSFSSTSLPVNIGATAFFQNDLSTVYGGVGVSVMNSRWDAAEPKGHLYLTYAGLLPKFKLTVDYGGEYRRRYSICRLSNDEGTYDILTANPLQGKNINATLTSFLPLSFNKGGWSRGVIPQLTYSINNHYFDRAVYKYRTPSENPISPLFTQLIGMTKGRAIPLQSISASLRGYSVLARPVAALFPRLGVGGQMGFVLRPGLTDKMTSTAYATAYGYLPGLFPLHAIKLSLTGLKQFDAPIAESSSLALPHGFTGDDALVLNVIYPNQVNARVEYGFPFADLQWSFLEPITYIKNLNLTLRAEGSILNDSMLGSAGLYGFGADLDMSLGNLVVIRADMRVGLSWTYIGGSPWNMLHQADGFSHNIFAPIFTIDF